MNEGELSQQADYNREVFERALGPYVALKIEHAARALERGERAAWLDATGCVWCLFDEPSFARSGDEATRLKQANASRFCLQVFWSMGDVVMPPECDASWVADRIVEEAQRQLREQGYRCRTKTREVEGERHKGVLFARTLFRWR